MRPLLFLLSFLFLFSCEEPNTSPPLVDENPVESALNADILTDRPAKSPGFILPKSVNSSKKSKYHTPTPELSTIINPKADDVFVISPAVNGWRNVPFDDPSIQYYLFTPGDYLPWGDLLIKSSGSASKRKVLMYYDSLSMGDEVQVVHAYKTDQANRPAIIEGIQIGDKRTGESFLTISGLTHKGKSWVKDGHSAGSGIFITPGSSDIKIVNCYSYKWRGARMYGNRIVFQENVVAGALGFRGDHGGVGIFTTEEFESHDCRVVGNEIYDQNNLIGAPKDGRDAEKFKFANGLIIADNDLFYTGESILTIDGVNYSCGGSAIDLKNGSDDPENPVVITGNRIRYLFPSPPDKHCGDNNGKLGEAVVLHKDARNTIIEDNVIYDVSRGFVTYPGTSKDMLTENVIIRNNLIHTITESVPGATGFAMNLTANNIDVYWNTIVNAQGFARTKDKMRIDVRGNRYIGDQIDIPASNNNLTVADNYVSEKPDIYLEGFHLICNPITGPDTLFLPMCVPAKDQKVGIELLYQDSGIEEWLEGVKL